MEIARDREVSDQVSSSNHESKLFDFVRSYPGCSSIEARDYLQCGRSAFETALESLIFLEKLVPIKSGGVVYLFLKGLDVEEWAPQVIAVRNPYLSRLYISLDSIGVATVSEIWPEFKGTEGWCIRRLRRRLERLVDVGLAEKYAIATDPNFPRYHIKPFHPEAALIVDSGNTDVELDDANRSETL